MTTAKPTKTTVLLRRRLLCRAARKDMAKMGRCWSGEMSADAPAPCQDKDCEMRTTSNVSKHAT